MFRMRKFLVMLFSLAAMMFIVACAGDDGSDGSSGTSSTIVVSDASPEQCPTGGFVYTIHENGVPQPNPQVVCNGSDGVAGTPGGSGSGGIFDGGGYSCYGCHEGIARAYMNPESVTRKFLGASTNDVSARAGIRGSAHFSSIRGTGCTGNGCHAGTNTNPSNPGIVTNSLYTTAMKSWFNVAVATNTSANCVDCHGGDVTAGSMAAHYERTPMTVLTNTSATADVNVSKAFDSCSNCHYYHNPAYIGRYFIENPDAAFGSGLHGNYHLNAQGGNYFADANGLIPASRATCAFCHTYNGAQRYNPMTGYKTGADITDLINAKGGFAAGMAATPLGCATCHDPHTGGLYRAKPVTVKANAKDSFGNDIVFPITDGPAGVADVAEGDNALNAAIAFVSNSANINTTADLTVYSAEFQLCSSCHTVALKYEWAMDVTDQVPAYNISADGSGAGRVFFQKKFNYYLDDAIYGGNTQGQTGSGGAVFNAGAGYHGGYFTAFAASHFATQPGKTIATKTSYTGTGGNTVWTVEEVGSTIGMNIDLASPKPCTACHDPHSTSRFAPGTTASGANMTQDNLDELIKTYSQSPHANYKGIGFNRASYGIAEAVNAALGIASVGNRNCMPCHNGRESTKFMDRAARGWGNGTAAQGRDTMQPGRVNTMGGGVASCGVCHIVNQNNGATDRTIIGILRMANGGNISGVAANMTAVNAANDFQLAAGGQQDGGQRADRMKTLMPDMYAKQVADKSLVCFTCHGGRTSIFWKTDRYDKNNQLTYHDNGTGGNDEYAHYAPAAGIVAGLLVPSVKESVAAGNIVQFVKDADKATWSTHPSLSGTSFPSCAKCHDMNASSHTFAVYKDAEGNPLRGAVNNKNYSDKTGIDAIASLYVNGSGISGCGCHGETSSYVANTKAFAGNYADVMNFLKYTIQQVGTDGHAIQYLGSGGTIFRAWNGTEWVANSAPEGATWRGDSGFQRYVIAMAFESMKYDFGAYAHLGQNPTRAILGQALKALYILNGKGSDTAEGFSAWLAAPGTTASGGNIYPLSDAAITWLNATANYANW